jgi:putative membrane protein
MIATILTDAGDGNYYRHMDGWDGGWMWLWGISMMVLFSVLIVWLLRSNITPSGQALRLPEPTDGARTILAERFAKGELSTDEYQERVEALR